MRELTDDDIMPLICLRCKAKKYLTIRTMHEISYTHYSYCEDCLRAGLKLLKEQDKQEKERKANMTRNEQGKIFHYLVDYSIRLKNGEELKTTPWPSDEYDLERVAVMAKDIHQALIAAENRIREKYAHDQKVEKIVVWAVTIRDNDVFDGVEPDEESDNPYQE